MAKTHGYIVIRIQCYLFAAGVTLSVVVGASPIAMESHYLLESTPLSEPDTNIAIRSRSNPPTIEPEYPVETTQSPTEGDKSASQSPNEDTVNEVSNQQLQSIGDVRPDPTSVTEVPETFFTTSSVNTGGVLTTPIAAIGSTRNPQNDLVVIGAINASFRIGTHALTPSMEAQGSLLREAPIVSYSHSYNSSCEHHWPTWILLALMCIILLLRWLVKSPQIEIAFWPRQTTSRCQACGTTPVVPTPNVYCR